MKFWNTKTAGSNSNPSRSKSYRPKEHQLLIKEYSRSKIIHQHRYSTGKDFKVQTEAWLESEKRLFAWFIVFYTYLNRDQNGIKVNDSPYRPTLIFQNFPLFSLANALTFSNFIFLFFWRPPKRYVGIRKKINYYFRLLRKSLFIPELREWNGMKSRGISLWALKKKFSAHLKAVGNVGLTILISLKSRETGLINRIYSYSKMWSRIQGKNGPN